MVSIVDLVGLALILAVNVTLAALLTRFFRVRLTTRWGPIVFAVVLIPIVLIITTQILSGIGLGFDLGSAVLVVGLTVLTPLAIGIAFDYLWQPAPEDIDLPKRYR